MIRMSAHARRASRARRDIGEDSRILARRWQGFFITWNVNNLQPKVGLEEVEHSTADGVLGAIDSCLRNRVGVLVGTQKEKLVNMNLDGASVNMGVYNGVGAIQRARCGEQVTVTHCINHNLELALMDLRKDEPYLDTFEKTLKVLFSIYQFYCVLKLNNISFYYQYYYSNIFTL